MEQVGGLVGHEEFGAVGGAQDQSAGGAQPRYDHGIVARDVALVQQAADFALIPRGGDGGLDGNGKAKQRTREQFPASASCEARPVRDVLRIEVGKGVEARIQALDLRDVRFGELGDGDRPERSSSSCCVAGLRTTSFMALFDGTAGRRQSSAGVDGSIW